MSTTPLWLTLLVAALSPVSALFGVWLTQRRADRREDATFTRELARERARWQREDQARTFEHRRSAYVDFYESLRTMGVRVHNHGYGLSDECDEGEELPFGWQTDTWIKLQHLEMYASPQVAELASNAYSTTYQWGFGARHGQFGATYHGDEEVADVAKAALLQAIRADLNVPGETGAPHISESSE
ncbi:hypothetical protein JN086_07515 [Mycolicibacterium austroafricanum]|uniref:Uncharacterized protein n=1 Tax=Mycolicibacterium austroafricanum TaxID=39687 RepID=A0ABT8HH42_MYCAO|nr:hypothetical protein [Mycolicibacterium austroafricanum]MDN4519602.1 hypothetical protein [Mycolicibacterium austroafricanum]QZT69849.1 hypothetical protein JN086_07515 [Mycolicibacterium austroafricanum]